MRFGILAFFFSSALVVAVPLPETVPAGGAHAPTVLEPLDARLRLGLAAGTELRTWRREPGGAIVVTIGDSGTVGRSAAERRLEPSDFSEERWQVWPRLAFRGLRVPDREPNVVWRSRDGQLRAIARLEAKKHGTDDEPGRMPLEGLFWGRRNLLETAPFRAVTVLWENGLVESRDGRWLAMSMANAQGKAGVRLYRREAEALVPEREYYADPGEELRPLAFDASGEVLFVDRVIGYVPIGGKWRHLKTHLRVVAVRETWRADLDRWHAPARIAEGPGDADGFARELFRSGQEPRTVVEFRSFHRLLFPEGIPFSAGDPRWARDLAGNDADRRMRARLALRWAGLDEAGIEAYRQHHR